MICPVCQNAHTDGHCPVCGFDGQGPEAKDRRAIESARDAFRARTKQGRVVISLWDKWRPWVALVLGFFLFATWMKACSRPGWPFWH